MCRSTLAGTSPRIEASSARNCRIIVDETSAVGASIRKTNAVLVVEQQVNRALAIADDAILLARGLVAWRGPANEAAQAMDDVLGAHVIEAPTSGAAAVPPVPDLLGALPSNENQDCDAAVINGDVHSNGVPPTKALSQVAVTGDALGSQIVAG